MASCQFFGVDAVVDAYRYRELGVWGIFDGREFMAGGNGEGELRQYLSMMSRHGSTAIYRLKVYKDVDDVDDLDDKTPCAGSFKFKLTESYDRVVSGPSAPVRQSFDVGDVVAEKLNEQIVREVGKVLEKKFNNDGEHELKTKEKPQTLSEIVMGFIENPEKLVGIIGAVKALMSPAPQVMGVPAALAGVDAGQHVSRITPEQQQEEDDILDNALNKLEEHDPDIVLHLAKLAELAEKKPQLFKMLITQLDAL